MPWGILCGQPAGGAAGHPVTFAIRFPGLLAGASPGVSVGVKVCIAGAGAPVKGTATLYVQTG